MNNEYLSQNSDFGVTNQSILRAFFIIDLFKSYDEKLSMKEIASLCQIPITTAIPVLNSLVAGGYLKRDPKTKYYELGLKLLEKGVIIASGLDLRKVADVPLRALAQEINLNVHLGILDGSSVVYVDRVEAKNTSITSSLTPSFVGKRIPAHCTALGKTLLAYIDPRKVYSLYANSDGFERFTPFTVSDWNALNEELETIRTKGYTVEDEQYQMGGLCIAAPIFGYDNTVIASVSASLIKDSEGKYKKRIDEVISSILSTSKEISSLMGYSKYLK